MKIIPPQLNCYCVFSLSIELRYEHSPHPCLYFVKGFALPEVTIIRTRLPLRHALYFIKQHILKNLLMKY
jgi:hypothetical protein